MVKIFEFTDYRKYLKAYFKDRKKTDSKFSHRWLACRLDLSTSNFIMLVMQGKRNLNAGLSIKISEVFKHTRKEALYFENMVNFIQAKTNKEKELHFSRMAAIRKNMNIDRIEEHQYEYYANWYNPVIRELVCNPSFDGNIEILSRMLLPSISLTQVKRSISLLLKLGMIKKYGNGYVQISPFIATVPEVNSLAITNFHRAMGKLGIESLDRIPKDERNITSSTIFLTAPIFDTVKEMIEDFRKELFSLAATVKQGERVYQINFQAFPISKSLKNKEQ
jgi:uncharacterized protein (TIGR02147 family)